MALINKSIFPILTGGFFFALANRCIPTFFTIFLSSKNYTNRDIIFISCLFYIGSLFTTYFIYPVILNTEKNIKLFYLAATFSSIIVLLQIYIDTVFVWLLIRFFQGVLDNICRNSLKNLILSDYDSQLTFFMNMGVTIGFLLIKFISINSFTLLFIIVSISLNLAHVFIHFQSIEHCENNIEKINKNIVNWYFIFQENKKLFIILTLFALLNSTFTIILPIILKNNNFANNEIFIVMLSGSLGNTFLQLIAYYIKNLFGEHKSISKMINIIIILYILCFFSIGFYQKFTGFLIFSIMGFQTSMNSIFGSIVKQNFLYNEYLYLNNAINQINNIGGLIASLISLIFINHLSQYGLFLTWLITIVFIKCIFKTIKIIDYNYEEKNSNYLINE
jgi:hypothetical protein